MVLAWIQLGIGAFLVIAPWLFGAGRSLIGWANAVIGVALVLINVWVIFGKETETQKAIGDRV